MADSYIQRKREQDRKAQNAARQRRRAYVEALQLQLLVTQHTATLNEETLLREIRELTGRNRELRNELQSFAAHNGRHPAAQKSLCMHNLLTKRVLQPRVLFIDFAAWQSRDFETHLNGPRLNPGAFIIPHAFLLGTGPHLDQFGGEKVQDDARTIVSQRFLYHGSNRGSATAHSIENETPTRETWLPHYVLGPYGSNLPPTVASVVPPHHEHTWLFDRILLDLVKSQRDLLERCGSGDQKMESEDLQAAGFVQPAARGLVDPVSRVITDVMLTFEEIRLPERLACAWLLHRVLKWQIRPTMHSYLAMPTWLRPTMMQSCFSHPIYLDALPWPTVRDSLILDPERYPDMEFCQIFRLSTTVNWSCSEMDLFHIEPVTERITLSPAFQEHIADLRHWTVSELLQSRWPELYVTINNS